MIDVILPTRAILTSKDRYLIGLQQLETAAQQVAIMQDKLELLEPQLKIAAEKVGIQVTQVQAAFEVADVQRENVKKDEKVAMEEASKANEIAENCTAIMADALPLIQEAETALNTLSSSDITILKTMRSPPVAIRVVGEAICILKDVKPDKTPNPSGNGTIEDYFPPFKKLLGDIKFLDGLIKFDKDNIPTAIIKKLQDRIMTNELFDPEKMKTVSSAAEGICKWVLAIVQYDKVAKVVAPKRVALKEAESLRDVCRFSSNV